MDRDRRGGVRRDGVADGPSRRRRHPDRAKAPPWRPSTCFVPDQSFHNSPIFCFDILFFFRFVLCGFLFLSRLSLSTHPPPPPRHPRPQGSSPSNCRPAPKAFGGQDVSREFAQLRHSGDACALRSALHVGTVRDYTPPTGLPRAHRPATTRAPRNPYLIPTL